ncbi:MAG: metalloregulator ArsR/SmtB family transcription factor [Pseudomonadota bacterium]
MDKLISITKALSDENRVRMLLLLKNRELCICRFCQIFKLAASTVSKHMQILKQSGLVKSRKDGKWVYFSLSSPECCDSIKTISSWILKNLENDDKVKNDQKMLNILEGK